MMNKYLDTAIEGAMFIVATTLVFIPESRSAPMRLACGLLFLIDSTSTIWRMWKAGILTLTPKQIYALPARPRASLLGAVAMLMSVIAFMVAGY